MVFLVTVLALLFYAAEFSSPQLLLALICLPILLTVAEAISPHTADGPLIGLLGCTFLWAITTGIT
jgi:phytol kinase